MIYIFCAQFLCGNTWPKIHIQVETEDVVMASLQVSSLSYPAVDTIARLQPAIGKFLVLDMEKVTSIDVSCAIEIVDLMQADKRSKLVNVDMELKNLLHEYGLTDQQIMYKLE